MVAPVFFIQAAVTLAVARLISTNGWDDGAITLAYSRTLTLFGLAVAGCEDAVRYGSFGELVPNTIYAKMNAPYTKHGLFSVKSRVHALLEVLLVLSMVPVILWLVILSGRRSSSQTRALASTPVCTIIFSLWLCAAAPLHRAVAALLGRSTSTIGVMEVTPASCRITGLAVDHLRALLGLRTIDFVTADIGGSALCCDRIRLEDIGLLANRQLARHGYGVVASPFARQNPDVVEVHQDWARLSGIYELRQSRANDTPAVIHETGFYVRGDHVQALIWHGDAGRCNVADPFCATRALKTHRYVGACSHADDVVFTRSGKFLRVSDYKPGPAAPRLGGLSFSKARYHLG